MDWLSHLQNAKNDQQSCVLVTIIGVSGSAPREVGAKMLVYPGGEIQGTVGGGQLELQIISEAKTLMKQSENGPVLTVDFPLGVKTKQCCGGTVQVLFELFSAESSLFIFGAGHVGQALCETASGLSLRLHLIDEREEWVLRNPNLKDVARTCQNPIEFAMKRTWSPSDMVVVLTHSHDLDFELVDFFSIKDIKYLGLIGSETKWAQMRKRLQSRGRTPDQIETIHCPIGIKTGGKTPKEVAISIAAELIQEKNRVKHASNSPTSTVRW